MSMQVFFRCDAALAIGSGHVQRCLSLAGGLTAEGADCHFLMRPHHGHLGDLVTSKSHQIHWLPPPTLPITPEDPASWAGAPSDEDSAVCGQILVSQPADWLIVDHYALDAGWHQALRPFCGRIMVIDDLANRPYGCDLLVDPNISADPARYLPWAPPGCELLTGPDYALLRPEFAALRPPRPSSVEPLHRILVSMGAMDQSNASGAILACLEKADLPNIEITVILGGQAPWQQAIRAFATQSRHQITLLTDVRDMAQQMLTHDLSIGAAGGTALERCCLGLPSIIVILAANQEAGARALAQKGAAVLLGYPADIAQNLPQALAKLDTKARATMAAKAHALCDGGGVARVITAMQHYAIKE